MNTCKTYITEHFLSSSSINPELKKMNIEHLETAVKAHQILIQHQNLSQQTIKKHHKI